jgi:hypothetical protein
VVSASFLWKSADCEVRGDDSSKFAVSAETCLAIPLGDAGA